MGYLGKFGKMDETSAVRSMCDIFKRGLRVPLMYNIAINFTLLLDHSATFEAVANLGCVL